MKEGKKGDGQGDPYRGAPINLDSAWCDECGGGLVKLETTLGETRIRGIKAYTDMYWVNACTICNRIVRVFDHEIVKGNIPSLTSTRIHKLRER